MGAGKAAAGVILWSTAPSVSWTAPAQRPSQVGVYSVSGGFWHADSSSGSDQIYLPIIVKN